MSRISAYLIYFVFLASQVRAQVIYERTYPNAFPSLRKAIELSDYSSVSFSNNSPCYFSGWTHVSPEGDILGQGGLAGESTHSLRTRQIARDSVLVSFREGPLDFDGPNFFKVLLWTQSGLTTLVEDSIPLFYWDDYVGSSNPVQYDAYLLTESHLVYRREDTLYVKNLFSGTIDFKEVFFHLTYVTPVKNGLMVFSAGLPPTYFDAQLKEVKTWLNLSSHPLALDLVSLDSFVLGINADVPTAIHAVNVFNEYSIDIDLSPYFTQIDSLVTRENILIITGQNGPTKYVLHLNQHFEIIHESPYAIPDSLYSWAISIYPDRIYAWRTDGMAGYKANYRVVYPYLDPQPITYVDLTLAEIVVDSVFIYSPSQGSPYILVLAASIINQSVDTLQSLTLHYEEDPSQFCDPGVYPAHYNDLATPPGDTAVVKIWAIVWADQIDEPFVRTFFVQHGNHHLDSIRTDNALELVYIYTSTEESVSTYAQAYPNPFKEFIIVDEHSESIQLNLFDQQGFKVASGLWRLDDLGKLPSGIYYLQVINGGATHLQKVVKVE